MHLKLRLEDSVVLVTRLDMYPVIDPFVTKTT